MNDLAPLSNVSATIQELPWSSPIWYQSEQRLETILLREDRVERKSIKMKTIFFRL